jgi:hypothetical protein
MDTILLLFLSFIVFFILFIISEIKYSLDFRKPKTVISSPQLCIYNDSSSDSHRSAYRTRQEFVDYGRSVALERSGSNPSENLNLGSGLSVNESSIMNSVIIPDSEVLISNQEENKEEVLISKNKKLDYIADRLKSIEESMSE